MTIDVFWRLPTHGEPGSHRHRLPYRDDLFPGYDGQTRAELPPSYSYIDYLAEIAHAAEISGFQGGLIPSFPMTDEPWVISAFLARETKTFRFMIPFQPGFLNPVAAARMTASLQRATGGRALYNVITGGGGPAQLWWGDVVAHDDRMRAPRNSWTCCEASGAAARSTTTASSTTSERLDYQRR